MTTNDISFEFMTVSTVDPKIHKMKAQLCETALQIADKQPSLLTHFLCNCIWIQSGSLESTKPCSLQSNQITANGPVETVLKQRYSDTVWTTQRRKSLVASQPVIYLIDLAKPIPTQLTIWRQNQHMRSKKRNRQRSQQELQLWVKSWLILAYEYNTPLIQILINDH